MTTQHGVKQLIEYQNAQRHEECLKWLSLLDHDAKQADFFSRVQEGTGNWLLNSTEFHNWISTNDPAHQKLDSNTIKTHRTLFCPGMPVAGKTFLASIVINHLQQVLRPNDVALAFFFCNFREKVTLDQMLATLLKQLVRQQSFIPHCLATLFERRSRLTTSDIVTGLKSASSTFSKVFIVIDALDECYLPDNLRTRFLLEIRTLQESCNLHVFATSRDNPEITTLFEGCSSLGIRANPEDVKRFLRGRIGTLPSVVQKKTDLQEEIITEISKAVDGMFVILPYLTPFFGSILMLFRFLLARLHIDSLQGKRSVKSIRQALKTLPIGLDASYTDAMSRIESQLPDEVETAKEVLCWISYATRSITPFELQHALAIEDYQLFLDQDNISDIEDLISVCAGLVTVDEQSGVVRLVHYTMQEYFDRNRDYLFPDAHHKIASKCIHYLSFDAFSDASVLVSVGHHPLLKDHPLLEYSAGNLKHHIRLQKVGKDLILGLLRRHENVNVVFGAWEHSRYAVKERGRVLSVSRTMSPQHRRGIHLAACLDHVGAIETILDDEEGGVADIKDYWGQTPLLFAAQYGSPAVAKFLLNRGVNPNSAQEEYSGDTPLIMSIRFGHTEVTRLLIESGADINRRNPLTGVTPLGFAAERGFEAVVRYLTGRGAIANPGGLVSKSPLALAALNSHWSIFDFLAKLVDDSFIRLNYRDLLCCAASGGNKYITTHLLERGDISVKLKISSAQYALCGKSSWADDPRRIARLSALEVLIAQEGVDANFQCDGEGLLHRCIDSPWQEGLETIFKLLYQYGADPNIKDKNGQSCLAKAVTFDWGNEWPRMSPLRIIRLLVDTYDQWGNIQGQDRSGRTPLHRATMSAVALVEAPERSNECEAIVRALLDRGAELISRDSTGKTPLSYAAQLSHVALVQMFLSRGAGADDKDCVGRTPLSHAVDFDPQNFRGVYDKRSEQFAAQWPFTSLNEVVEILLSNGADPDFRDHEGMTPLLRAEMNLPEDHEALRMLRKVTSS